MDKIKLIKKFLKIINYEQNFIDNIKIYLESLDSIHIDKILFCIENKKEELLDKLIMVYNDIYTIEELIVAINFYSSPVGQSFINKTQQTQKQTLEVSQKFSDKHILPEIQKILESCDV
jgi:hypothetical protein